MSASVAFAATDDDIAVGEVDDEIAIDETVLAIDEDTAVLQEDKAPVAENTVVTNSTFYQYFDKTGSLLNNTTADELMFEGDFSGVGVNYIIIDKPIKLTGNNATFNAVSFAIISNNVTIDGFKLIQHKDASLITVNDATNVVISNNEIDYEALPESDSYAIYAANVNNLKLIDNLITYVGNTNGTVYNFAVRILGNGEEKSKNIEIRGNGFNITMPSSTVYYDEYWNSYDFTDGISVLGSENVTISDNAILLKYNNATGGADTINVIVVGNCNYDWDVYDFIDACKNVVVSNNTIGAEGHNYIYGVRVVADNFLIEDNKLSIYADYHYANGITVDGPSTGGIVRNNKMMLGAPNLVFGIYSYPYMGSVTDITFDSNVILGKAYAACGMEIVEENPTIISNKMALMGNHTTGIVANMNENGTISDNIIYSLGSNVGTNATGDGLIHPESVGISVKGDTLISNNTINSTSIGVNLILGGEFTLTNNTINVTAVGDTDNYGVYADGIDALVACDNYITFTGQTNGTILSIGFYADGIDDVVIRNNTMDLNLVSAHVDWLEIPAGSWNYVRTPYSEGIVIKDCDGAIFDANDVSVHYNNFTNTSDDTIYVVDLLDSPNSIISNNFIVANGHTYMYPIIIASTNFTVSDNKVYSIADEYAAYGINIESGSSGVVKDNMFAAMAPDVAYTVYTSAWDMSRVNVDYINNQLYGKAYYVNVLDIGGATENIINNTIIAEGNYTVAVYSASLNGNISGNTIRSLGSGEGNKTIPYTVNEIKAIKLSSAAVISNNYVESAGDYAIDLGNADSTVKNSYIAAKKSVGANAIANAGSGAVISNITPSLKSILSAAVLYTTYDAGNAYYVILKDENGDAITNASLLFTGNHAEITAKTDNDGVAAFLVDDWDAGEYEVEVFYYGDITHGPKSMKGFISIEPRVSIVDSPASKTVLLTAVKTGSYVVVTLTDDRGVYLSNKTVSISFNGQTKNYTTDSFGVVKYKLSATTIGTKNLTVVFDSDANYVSSLSTSKIVITKEATKLVAANKVYNKKAKVKNYAVVLRDSKNKPIKKVKLMLKIGKRTYYAYTNAYGKAIFKITKFTTKGRFTSLVRFAGNNYYKLVSKKVIITMR